MSNAAELKLWVEAEIKSVRHDLKRHDQLLVGTGSGGLLQSTAKMEEAVMRLMTAVQTMERSAVRMEKSAIGQELYVKALGKQVADLNKQVSPLVDWKKGIYLRVTTVVATAGAIFGAAWWVIENMDKLKAFFR